MLATLSLCLPSTNRAGITRSAPWLEQLLHVM
jgi:hypothetical protein